MSFLSTDAIKLLYYSFYFYSFNKGSQCCGQYSDKCSSQTWQKYILDNKRSLKEVKEKSKIIKKWTQIWDTLLTKSDHSTIQTNWTKCLKHRMRIWVQVSMMLKRLWWQRKVNWIGPVRSQCAFRECPSCNTKLTVLNLFTVCWS